jgi:hypothetical protein
VTTVEATCLAARFPEIGNSVSQTPDWCEETDGLRVDVKMMSVLRMNSKTAFVHIQARYFVVNGRG